MEKELIETVDPKSVVWSVETKDRSPALVKGHICQFSGRDVVFVGDYDQGRIEVLDSRWHKDPKDALTEYTAKLITLVMGKMDWAFGQVTKGACCVPLPTLLR